MPKIYILFFGSSANSNLVKSALIKAGYNLISQADKACLRRQAALVISADYGKRLPAGGLNLHPSLLPKYRGPTPVPWQILNQESESGISLIKMTDKFDAGPIIAQEKVPIFPHDTSADLLKRCFTAGAQLLLRTLPAYMNTKITLLPQDESQATFTHKFTKQDGFISWEEFKNCLKIVNCKLKIARRIRALYPWPGVWTTMPNNRILKLLPNNLVQLQGKNPISFPQFLAGYRHLLK